MIEYFLQKEAGFFSEFFFMVNHYIYCKRNGVKFSLNTDNWMFKSSLGWNDYFEVFYNNVEISDTVKQYRFGNIIEQYPIFEYKYAIPEIYRYNTNVQNEIHEINQRLGICDNEYGSIFIRRGDKLLHESKLHPTKIYIQKLLQKMPDCRVIFIQTDDYTCILEAEDYINENALNIRVCTLCNKNQKGVFTVQYHKYSYARINKNVEYMNSIQSHIQSCKSVCEMNSYEIYQHTLEMISGIDIVLKSNYCILDYQSNVSRFIKLAHPIYDNVIDIEGYDLDLKKRICPAFPESVYDDVEKMRHS